MRFVAIYFIVFASCFLALGMPDDQPDHHGLQSGDQVSIRPLNSSHGFAPLFRVDLTVDAAGQVKLPNFDLKLDVKNLPPADAGVLLCSALRDSSGLPDLDLSIIASRDGVPLPGQHCITIGGKVRQPGHLPLAPGLTLGQAVEAAGGATEFGSTKRIRVFRNGSVRSYDLAKPRHAAHRLTRYDIIEVPAKVWIGR